MSELTDTPTPVETPTQEIPADAVAPTPAPDTDTPAQQAAVADATPVAPVAPVAEAAPTAETPPPETPAEEAIAPPERVVPAADGYVLPEGVPTEVGKFASENDMTQAQLDSNLDYFSKVMSAQNTQAQTVLREAGEAHVENWGENKQYNMTLAKRALSQMDPDGALKAVLDESGYGNHPVVLDHFLRQGQSLKEGGFLKSAVNRPPGKKTAATAMYGDNHPSNE